MTLLEKLSSLTLTAAALSVTVLYLFGPWWALVALWVAMSVPVGLFLGAVLGSSGSDKL